MATTTTAHRSTISDRPLRIGEPVIAFSADVGAVELLIVIGAASRGWSNFGARAEASLIERGVTGAILFSAGKTRSRIGAQAVSAGTSNSVESVTSQTR